MKVHTVTKISIRKKRAEVFKYLADLRYHYLWNPHLRRISPLDVVKLGTEYKSVTLLLGVKVRGKNVITKLLPNQEVEIVNNIGTLQYKVSYRLQSKRKETLLVCTTSVYSENGAFAFTAPILKLLARRELQTDLQALKIAVEQQLQV